MKSTSTAGLPTNDHATNLGGRWPWGSGCAAPHANVKGRRGVRLHAQIRYLGGRQHLPIVALREAA
jgi:hypothetical protein